MRATYLSPEYCLKRVIDTNLNITTRYLYWDTWDH